MTFRLVFALLPFIGIRRSIFFASKLQILNEKALVRLILSLRLNLLI